MIGASRLVLAAVLVAFAAPAGAACFYLTPGCAEWYVDSNGVSHSIRSDWRGLQGSPRHRAGHRYRHTGRRSSEPAETTPSAQ